MALGNIETRRKTAIAEAQSLGIDTEGMSTRQVKASITETKEAQTEMADFINKVLDARPAPVAQNPTPAVPVTRTTEDTPSTITRSGSGAGGIGSVSVPVPFYTWVNGEVGKVIVLCQTAPSPLE